MTTQQRHALAIVSRRLSEGGVPHLLGGSALLAARGIDVAVGDLDLTVPGDARDAVERALADYAPVTRVERAGAFASAFVTACAVEGVAVEVVGGIALRRGPLVEHLPLEQEGTVDAEGVAVPLADLAGWHRIYATYRPERARLIERARSREG